MPKSKKNKNNNFIEYYVEGMHCSACEVLIEKDIEKIEGVSDVKANLSAGKVKIYSDKKVPSEDKLNNVFDELGYKFHKQKIKEKSLDQNDLILIIGGVIVFIMLFLLAEKSGIFLRFSLTETSSLPTYFIFGLAAGVSSCAALVGGILLSLSQKWNDSYRGNTKKSGIPFIMFNIGRIASFALLGGILGLIGATFKISVVAMAILTLFVSVIMFILGLQIMGIRWAQKFTLRMPKSLSKYSTNDNNLEGKYMPFIIGALTFFVPCGFTLIAQTNALTSGNFVTSALMLVAFALGTLPMLALISFSSVKFYNNKAFSKKFSLFAGLLITFFAFYTFNSQLNVLGAPSLSDVSKAVSASPNKKNVKGAQVAAPKEGKYQILNMTAKGFEYFPKVINIDAGVPTKWRIDNQGSYGCAAAVFGRGLYNRVINLKQGVNEVDIGTPKPGSYKVSCSMGMVSPITVNVN
jgi:sulfite exporter TauE/SafE/copper chaperone CopZ